MLLLIQIVLTIIVWQKGYRWYALIPMGCAFATGLIIGAFAPSAEVMWETIADWWWIDALAAFALFLMIILNPYPKKEKVHEKERVLERDTEGQENNS